MYKTDFEAEKDLARSMKTEKEKIAEDLNIIQNRNEQLLREIEQLRGTLNITNAPNTSNASSNSNFQNLAPKQVISFLIIRFMFIFDVVFLDFTTISKIFMSNLYEKIQNS